MSGGSGPTAAAPGGSPARARPVQRYGTIVVVGGGCYGSYYVRQLGRAVAAEALTCRRVLVVDRDRDCTVGRAVAAGAPPEHQDATAGAGLADPFSARGIDLTLVGAEWGEFFAGYLAAAADDPEARADAVVPSPLMPHLLYDWIVARARARWPGRALHSVPLHRPPATPWERRAADGTHYVSFAEWMCPINCVEPPLCPEIAGPRTWSLPPALRAYVAAERAAGRDVAGPVLLHCTHRAYGVGMIDVRDVIAGDAVVAAAGAGVSARVLVGTVSHCHGAVNLLDLGAATG
jgi:hypothetical protein